MTKWEEPGRFVTEDGRIRYQWPPAGRFKGLWERVEAAFADDEKNEVLSLLKCWRDENSELVAYTDPVTNEWVSVDWEDVF